MKATTTTTVIAIRETHVGIDTMTTNTVNTGIGDMTGPTGMETIMMSITQMAIIATGKDNADHNNAHDRQD